MKISQLSLFIGLLLLASNLIGQTTNSTWQKAFENHKVLFETQYVNCENTEEGFFAEYVWLKITNKTNENLTVTWFNDSYYNDSCLTCDHTNTENLKELFIKAKTSITSDCELGSGKGLRIFSKWLKQENEQVLSKFEITDVKLINQQKN